MKHYLEIISRYIDNMKSLYVLCLLLAVAAVSGYDTALDDFDYNEIITKPYLLKEFNDCFVDLGPCHGIAIYFKQFIQRSVHTLCAHCTSAQKRIGHNFLDALEHNLPEDYELFKKKYDPYGFYFEAFRAVLADH